MPTVIAFPSESSDRVCTTLADRYRGTGRAQVIASHGANNRFDNSKRSGDNEAFLVVLRVVTIVSISRRALPVATEAIRFGYMISGVEGAARKKKPADAITSAGS